MKHYYSRKFRFISMIMVVAMIVTMMPATGLRVNAEEPGKPTPVTLVSANASQAVQRIIGEGNTAVTLVGTPEFICENGNQLALFDESAPEDIRKFIGIDNGLVLSDGDATKALYEKDTGYDIFVDADEPEEIDSRDDSKDTDLYNVLVSGGDDFHTHDLASLRFTVKANAGGTMVFKYAFASSEFTEDSKYNDIFGLFVRKSGEGNEYENLAKMITEDTSGTLVKKDISITNLRGAIEAANFDKEAVSVKFDGATAEEPKSYKVFENPYLPYNGMTNVYYAEYEVEAGEIYDIKLSIADVTDQCYNSTVFLQGGSFDIVPATPSFDSNYLNPRVDGHLLYIKNNDSKSGNITIYSKNDLNTALYSKEIAGGEKFLLTEKDVEGIAENGYGLYYVFFEAGGKKSASRELTIGTLKTNKPVVLDPEDEEAIAAAITDLTANGGTAKWENKKNPEDKNKLELNDIYLDSSAPTAIVLPDDGAVIDSPKKSYVYADQNAISSTGSIEICGEMEIKAGGCGIESDSLKVDGNLDISAGEVGISGGTFEITGDVAITSEKSGICGETLKLGGDLDISAGECGIQCDTLEVSDGKLEINVKEGGNALDVNKLIIPKDYIIIGGTIDKDGRFVQNPGATKIIIRPNHIHDKWTYSADGATLTAKCGSTDDLACTLKDAKATLTLLIAPTFFYGTTPAAEIGTKEEKEIWGNAKLIYPAAEAFEYYSGAEKLTAIPKEVGKYTVKLTYEGKTVAKDFEIVYSLDDYKKMFEEHKATVSANCAKLAVIGDSEETMKLIADAKEAINKLSYDEKKSLDENKAIVDEIYNKLVTDVKNSRYVPGPEGPTGEKYITDKGDKAEFVCNYVVRDSSKKEYTVTIYRLKDDNGKFRYGLMNTKTHTMDMFTKDNSDDLDEVKASIKQVFREAADEKIASYVEDDYKTIPTVYLPTQAVGLKADSSALFEGEKIELPEKVKFRIKGATKKETKAMKKVAGISKKGKIKTKRTGYVTVEAYQKVKEGKKTVKMTVARINVPIVKPKFNRSLIASYAGQSFDIEDFIKSATIGDKEYTGNTLARNMEAAGYKLTWKSVGKKNIATIDEEKGIVTVGSKSGKYKYKMIITNPVTGKHVTYKGSITLKLPELNKKSLKLSLKGKKSEKKLGLKNISEEAFKTVSYEVADKSVATVDGEGNVKAVSSGDTEVTVSVRNEDGSFTRLVCSVHVKGK